MNAATNETLAGNPQRLCWWVNSRGRKSWSYAPPSDHAQVGEFVLSFGRFRNWTLRQVTRDHGSQYVRWLIGRPQLRQTYPHVYREARRIVLEELQREIAAENAEARL